MGRLSSSFAALCALLFSLPPEAFAQGAVLLAKGARGSVTREELVRGGSKVVRVSFSLREARTDARSRGSVKYTALSVDKLPLTSEVGLPALPFQAVTVDAALPGIRVRADLGEAVTLRVGRLFPAQEEPCRCAERGKAPVFRDKTDAFVAAASGFRLESLGDFRGQPVSRVLLFPHRYDPKTGVLRLYPRARFEVSYDPAPAIARESLYDYLVITPRRLMGGLADWVGWKRSSQGLRFNIVAYEDIGSPGADALEGWIHAEYAKSAFRYALLVGPRSLIPQKIVATTTDQRTPSDLPYFAMGGADDVIPEAYAGRVVAADPETLERVLKKWMSYERDSSAAAGWHRSVGVASNEGADPSDAEYIDAIQSKLKAAYEADPVTLYQNNADSHPANFNAQLATGAMWVTYLGHGSGTSWPSFGSGYSIPDIQALRNAEAVKPIWIDVACLNGVLEPTAGGAHLAGEADPSGAPVGVTAYYGGTVLISWHPPAIFARGVAFQLAAMLRPTLGEALQAGQRYLTENISNAADIASNQRWYHLQGDPSMRLRLR